ncbi:MAG: hypothetical protein QGF59_24575, partial [Pirellulaceae bacterium]|nr:hypothetical protein [Pirellulaceae bacterium]
AKLSAPPGDNNLRDHFGSSVDVDQDTIVVGANGDDGNGTDAGAAYVFVRSGSTWSPAAKLTAEVATSSEFGYDVSVSGDTVVVGAPFDNDLGDNTGAAFVFERQGGANNWSQPVQLTPQDLDAGDKLGVATSIVDDMIVVGASSNQVDGITTGSAYVFERVAGVWSQTTRLVSSDNVNNDQLGIAVATDGESIVAGDHLLDISGTNNAGAAYIYANDGSGWSETEKLVAEVLPAPAFDQQFGWSVDANENYAVVGAPFDVTTDTKQGAAYVYERDDNGTPNPTDDVWNFRTRLAGATGEKFGYSVGVSSDGDVVVGAIFAGTSDQGAAYVFERNHNGTPFDGSD